MTLKDLADMNKHYVLDEFLSNLGSSEEALTHIFPIPFDTIKSKIFNSNQIQRAAKQAIKSGYFVFSMEKTYRGSEVRFSERDIEIDFKVKRGVVCAEIKGKLSLVVFFRLGGREVGATYSGWVDFSVMVFSDDFHGVKHELGDLYLDLYTQEI